MGNEIRVSEIVSNLKLAKEIEKERITDQLKCHGKTDAQLQREADLLLKKAGHSYLTKIKD